MSTLSPSLFYGDVVVLAGGWAYFRTPNIKIGDRTLAAYPPAGAHQ